MLENIYVPNTYSEHDKDLSVLIEMIYIYESGEMLTAKQGDSVLGII